MWLCVLLLLSGQLSPSLGANQVHHIILNEKSNVHWSVNYYLNTIQFEIHTEVKNSEWFAIGFSDYGELFPSDLCIFWRDWRKNVHFQDTWSDEKGTITVDKSQDCNQFKFTQFKDILKFTFLRKFDTCDANDYLIEEGTTHIVWASGKGPLYSLNGLNLHSKISSGFERTRLLQFDSQKSPHPNDTWTLEIKSKEVKVPNEETTYWCHIAKLPHQLRKKHHVIQYEPAIQEGHEHVIHHMEVFHCEAGEDEIIPNYDGPCEDLERPEATKVCKHVLAAWAMGATAFPYPEEAGLAIGGPDFNQYVMLEIHYHNPHLEAGIVDNSGVRFYLTPTLRKFDAGVMELGLEYTDKMAIPPEQTNFQLSGYCIKECTAVALPERGIVVFGSQLHTHLTGIQVYTKHVRNGVELSELNRDNHYSPHFQEIRRLKNDVQVLPGDALITTCTYKTSNRKNITLGGFSTSDEMCVNYIHYYPRNELEVCKSAISEQDLSDYFRFMAEWEKQDTLDNKGISDRYKAIEWTPLRVRTLHQLYDLGTLSMQCNQSSGERFPGLWEGLPNSKIIRPLYTSGRKCSVLFN